MLDIIYKWADVLIALAAVIVTIWIHNNSQRSMRKAALQDMHLSVYLNAYLRMSEKIMEAEKVFKIGRDKIQIGIALWEAESNFSFLNSELFLGNFAAIKEYFETLIQVGTHEIASLAQGRLDMIIKVKHAFEKYLKKVCEHEFKLEPSNKDKFYKEYHRKTEKYVRVLGRVSSAKASRLTKLIRIESGRE